MKTAFLSNTFVYLLLFVYYFQFHVSETFELYTECKHSGWLSFSFLQSEHSHHSHVDHERNESRGEFDPLTEHSTTPTKEKKKVGITFNNSPPSASSGGGVVSFDNPAVNFDLENEKADKQVMNYDFGFR